ncbi:MAG: DUF397 domain-containing protein [Pseudomonas sp.]
MKNVTWRTSSYSSGQGGNCVAVADLDSGRAVRDSKNPTGPVLVFSAVAWSAFTTGIRAGEFD